MWVNLMCQLQLRTVSYTVREHETLIQRWANVCDVEYLEALEVFRVSSSVQRDWKIDSCEHIVEQTVSYNWQVCVCRRRRGGGGLL